MREVGGCELFISFDKPSMNNTTYLDKNVFLNLDADVRSWSMILSEDPEKNGMCARLIILQ